MSKFRQYRNKETGEIIEWDGMLFLSNTPQVKFMTNAGVVMMTLPNFKEQYEPVLSTKQSNNDKQ